jgi:serine/threonine protein kinase
MWHMQVALKRISDVLNNAENAKRVLREVCILRRLSHPHIISLRDVFLKPSSTGGGPVGACRGQRGPRPSCVCGWFEPTSAQLCV